MEVKKDLIKLLKKKKYFDTNEQKYGFNINIENKEEMVKL